MKSKREHGRINENTFLIDSHMFGCAGIGAVYLVGAGKTCLIDAGSSKEAPRISRVLKNLGAFPPDYVILTHSHWDHSQGVPFLRKKAEKEQKKMEVMAGEQALPLLEDQSYNKAFHENEEFENIGGVTPLKEGDVIDLDGLKLKVLETPGHNKDHIALFDEKNKNLFVGDSLGINLGHKTTIPPFMPPFFDKDAFYKTIKKLRSINFEGIALAHFGHLRGEEAEGFLDEAAATLEQWWQIFETVEQENKLEDKKHIASKILQSLDIVVPDFEIKKPVMRWMLRLMNFIRKIRGKEPLKPGKLLLPEIAGWLSKGYQIYKEGQYVR